MAEAGIGWMTRKMANVMAVHLEVEARIDGIFMLVKTKIRNQEVWLLYDQVNKRKGLTNDEDVETTVAFDDEGVMNTLATVSKGGKQTKITRSYKIVNNQLIITQSCNGITGTRVFEK